MDIRKLLPLGAGEDRRESMSEMAQGSESVGRCGSGAESRRRSATCVLVMDLFLMKARMRSSKRVWQGTGLGRGRGVGHIVHGKIQS